MRFNRRNLALDLWKQIQSLQEVHNFTDGNGWDQVRHLKIETIVAYGAWRRLVHVFREWGLAHDLPDGVYTGIGVVGRGKVRD
jgi:hypothetical protein